MKAVLIINMPEKCIDCPYCVCTYDKEVSNEIHYWCFIKREAIIDREEKEDNCPLIPVPQELEEKVSDELQYSLGYAKGYDTGFNDFNKILGETE